MSCQTSRSSDAPCFDADGQVRDGQRDRQGRNAVLVRQEIEVADDVARLLGDDAHDQLGRVVHRERGLGRGNRPVAIDQADLEVAAEPWWLRIQPVGLLRLGGQVDPGAEPRAPLGAAGEPQLTADRRPRVGEVDVDRHPRPDPDMPVHQDVGLHGEAGRRLDREGRRRDKARQQRTATAARTRRVPRTDAG